MFHILFHTFSFCFCSVLWPQVWLEIEGQAQKWGYSFDSFRMASEEYKVSGHLNTHPEGSSDLNSTESSKVKSDLGEWLN